MKLLTRYLAREVYYSIGIIFAALLALFTFLDLVREVDNIGEGDYHLGYMLLYITLSVPGYIYELLPVAVLVGTIFALVQMASNSELTIYRASGMSLWQMLLALFKVALPLIVLGFFVSEFLSPYCERMAKQVRMKAQNEQVSLREFRSGVWVKDDQSFVNVKNVQLDSTLGDVQIFKFDQYQQLRHIIRSESATFLQPGQWQLQDVSVTTFNQQGIKQARYPTRSWSSSLTPNILDVLLVSPDQMSAYDLYHYTNHLMENNQKSGHYRIAMWHKLVYPFTLLVMMLLAVPFASYHKRSGGVSGMIFVGIVLGLCFHFVSQLSANLGALNDWSPFLSATIVPVIFLSVGMVLLWHSERR